VLGAIILILTQSLYLLLCLCAAQALGVVGHELKMDLCVPAKLTLKVERALYHEILTTSRAQKKQKQFVRYILSLHTTRRPLHLRSNNLPTRKPPFSISERRARALASEPIVRLSSLTMALVNVEHVRDRLGLTLVEKTTGKRSPNDSLAW